MKAILVMFDSIKRDYLSCYGCDWTHTPNFARLAEKTAVFDRNYVGSMPCMPARRELHTGRYGFLHRGWGPLEPFDDSMPELLKKNGVYSHIVTDHEHYWQDGGAAYMTRFSSWEAIRGQEGDNWKADLDPAIAPEHMVAGNEHYALDFNAALRFDVINRRNVHSEADKPQTRTFTAGLEFLETNWRHDNWFLQIEEFDPHEPFDSWQDYQTLYPKIEIGREVDWPAYGPCEDDDDVIQHVRNKYAALLSQCDHSLGRVLDFMDEHEMWEDTMLIVCTDHGFLLGEHDWWAKTYMPLYETVTHTPLFIWDPRTNIKGVRRSSLTQTIDLAPTVLEFFGLEIPQDMQGKSLRQTILTDEPVREYALFGHHACHVYITDGHYVYMRGPIRWDHTPVNEYTLMPLRMTTRYDVTDLRQAKLCPGFSFTKGCPVLAMPTIEPQGRDYSHYRFAHRLYDLVMDPGQTRPLDDPEIEARLMNVMARLMAWNDAPAEQYVRLGLRPEADMDAEYVLTQRECQRLEDAIAPLDDCGWTYEAKEQYLYLRFKAHMPNLDEKVRAYVAAYNIKTMDCPQMEDVVLTGLPENQRFWMRQRLHMMARRL